MTTEFGSAKLCALIIEHLDQVSTNQPNGAVYTYGARPGDIRLVPPPTRTTIIIAVGETARWFEIAVREVHPTADPSAGSLYDPEIMAALSDRAGLRSVTSLGYPFG